MCPDGVSGSCMDRRAAPQAFHLLLVNRPWLGGCLVRAGRSRGAGRGAATRQVNRTKPSARPATSWHAAPVCATAMQQGTLPAECRGAGTRTDFGEQCSCKQAGSTL